MYLKDYLFFLIALGICMIFSLYADRKVKAAYGQYGLVFNKRSITGFDAATRLLRANQIYGVTVGRVNGHLTDHYHPTHETVNLSESTYGSTSVAAVAIAAHEIGHVVQKHKGSLLYRIRTALVPVVNFGSRISMLLVLVGILLDAFVLTAGESNPGFVIAMIGVALYGSAFLFTLVTLPVELDASRRAKKMLLAEGILREEEMEGAEQVLSAAALTYLASMLTSLVYFLRFFLYVLSIFGRRDD